jgi:hypothetical protein
MADVGRLAGVLADYERILAEERRRVTEAHVALVDRYRALSAVYAGSGAEQFKAEWDRVVATFDTYTEGVPKVLELLAEKVEQLRAIEEGL